jgi:hypothetical protein
LYISIFKAFFAAQLAFSPHERQTLPKNRWGRFAAKTKLFGGVSDVSDDILRFTFWDQVDQRS